MTSYPKLELPHTALQTPNPSAPSLPHDLPIPPRIVVKIDDTELAPKLNQICIRTSCVPKFELSKVPPRSLLTRYFSRISS